MLNPNTNLLNLSNEEYKTYTQHIVLEHVGIQGQKRLKKSKILIIGAGGLGCPALLYLTASGIGYIGIIDNDEVDYSNLNRQILYQNKDINKKKVILAKKRLQEINPECKIITHLYHFNEKNGKEIIQYYDIIIDGTDNFKTRYIIDKICYKLHKTHVYGGIEEFEGQIAIFNYKNGIRYSNLYSKEINLKNKNCNINGVLGTTSGLIGIIQATEALKIIIGINQKIHNNIIICNLLNMQLKQKKIYISLKAPKKLLNSKHQDKRLKNTEIISEKNIGLIIKNKKYIVLDIRNRNEFKQKQIKPSINIPFKYFKLQKTINFIKNYYNNNKMLAIYCNTTSRSLIASHILNNNKIKHCIIKIKK